MAGLKLQNIEHYNVSEKRLERLRFYINKS